MIDLHEFSDSSKPAVLFVPSTKLKYIGLFFLSLLSLSLSLTLANSMFLFLTNLLSEVIHGLWREEKSSDYTLEKGYFVCVVYCFGSVNRFEFRICWIVTESARAYLHHIQDVRTLAVHELNIYYLLACALACLRGIAMEWWKRKRRSCFLLPMNILGGNKSILIKKHIENMETSLGLVSWCKCIPSYSMLQIEY